MTDLHALINSPFVHRLGMTLLHSLWQGATVLALFFVALIAMRRASSAARYAAVAIAMFILVAAPVATFVVINQPAIATITPSPTVPVATPQTSTALTGAGHRVMHQDASAPMPVAMERAAAAASSSAPSAVRDSAANWIPWFVMAWLVGVVLIAVRNVGGWIALQQLRSLHTTSVGDDVDRCVRKLAGRLGIGRKVRVLQSALARTPMVIGFFKPVILIPASAITALSMAELESILAHELAHIRRHDYLVNLLQAVAETLLFYHPAVWIISRQLRAERENCCDDLALSVTRDRRVYATALAAVASVRVSSLVPAASSGKLLPRLQRVLQSPAAETNYSSRWAAGILVAGCITIAMIAPHLQSTATAADHNGAATKPASDDIVRVHGRVLDPNGKPAAGAKVTAVPTWAYVNEEGRPTTIANTVAGSDGRFELSFKKSDASCFALQTGFPGDDLWKKTDIAASAEGAGLDWEQFDHVDVAGDLQLKLVRDVPLHGRLVDLEGNGAGGVVITVGGLASHILTDPAQYLHPPENFRGLSFPLADRKFVSDATGRFTIAGLGEERKATLHFSSENFFSFDESVATREGKALNVATSLNKQIKLNSSTFELMLAPAAVVTGVVRDVETHEPIAGAVVETYYRPNPVKTRTDAQGRYRLAGFVRRDSTQLIIKTTEQPYVPAVVMVPKQSGIAPAVIDAELFKGVWITGKVTDKDTRRAIPAFVSYLPYAANKSSSKNPLWQLGYGQSPCSAEVLADGSYRLVAHSGPGIVAVRVPQSNYTLGQGFDAIKNKDWLGRVRTYIPGLVNSSVYNAVKEIDAEPGKTLTDVNFALDGGRLIHIVCTDPDGKPLDKISVMGDTSSLISVNPSNFTGGAFDAISFTGDEKRMIVIRDEERELAKIAMVRLSDATNGKLTIKLEPTGKLTGRLLNSQGDPIKQGAMQIEMYVSVLKPDNGRALMANADNDGRFNLQIPPGTPFAFAASVSRYGGDFKLIDANLKLKAGETKDLGDLTIDEKETSD